MRSIIDYASGLDESGARTDRDRKAAERLARIQILEEQMRNARHSSAPELAGALDRILDRERTALAEMTKEEPQKEEAMPVEILAENLTEEQRAQVRASIAAITDLDVTIVEACNYSPAELVDVFNQATQYHNKIAQGFTDIEKVHTRHSIRTGGDTSRNQTIYNYGAEAVKIQAKLDFYNHSLTRLAQGIAARAVLQTVKGLHP